MISEQDLKDTCPYCGRRLETGRWGSVFDFNSLYKEIPCTCGRSVMVKMRFMGSGDDSWSMNLDKRIEEADP